MDAMIVTTLGVGRNRVVDAVAPSPGGPHLAHPLRGGYFRGLARGCPAVDAGVDILWQPGCGAGDRLGECVHVRPGRVHPGREAAYRPQTAGAGASRRRVLITISG